LVKAYQIFFI